MTPEQVVAELEAAAQTLVEDMQYPVDAAGNVLLLNYTHPDLVPTLVYHLLRCGWRRQDDKRLVKQRAACGPGVPDDYVVYVPLDSPDDVIVPEPQKREDMWSMKPVVNDIVERRDPA